MMLFISHFVPCRFFRAQFYHEAPAAAKTKAASRRLVTCSSPEDPQLTTDWPTDGWSTKAGGLPEVDAMTILEQLQETGKAVPGQDWVVVAQKPLRRGYDFYFGGHVHDVRVRKKDYQFLVESKCWASQKNSSSYAKSCISKPCAK